MLRLPTFFDKILSAALLLGASVDAAPVFALSVGAIV